MLNYITFFYEMLKISVWGRGTLQRLWLTRDFTRKTLTRPIIILHEDEQSFNCLCETKSNRGRKTQTWRHNCISRETTEVCEAFDRKSNDEKCGWFKRTNERLCWVATRMNGRNYEGNVIKRLVKLSRDKTRSGDNSVVQSRCGNIKRLLIRSNILSKHSGNCSTVTVEHELISYYFYRVVVLYV